MSHLAISLSFNSPHFHCEISPSLIIHPSLSLSSFSIHPSLPPSSRQALRAPSGRCTVLLCFGWFRYNRVLWVLQGLLSEVSLSYAWGAMLVLTNRTDRFISHIPPSFHTHTHTHKHTLTPGEVSLSDSSLFTPVGPVAWICIRSFRLRLDSFWWLSHHNGRQNENLQTTPGLSWLHFRASVATT